MGAMNHLKIPECIVSYIHSICPSDNGKYTGYCDADGCGDADGCVDVSDHEFGNYGVGNVHDGHGDALKASFEEVQCEVNSVHVAFDRAES